MNDEHFRVPSSLLEGNLSQTVPTFKLLETRIGSEERQQVPKHRILGTLVPGD
jgi:hypothetical protein